MQQSKDGGYIIAGYTSFTDGKKAWIIKIDSLGNNEWNLATGKTDSEAACVQLTKDGGYIITGYTPSSGTGKEDVLADKDRCEGELGLAQDLWWTE